MSKIQTNTIQHTANGAAVFTLPTSDGSANQVLKTNGSGTLSFVAHPDLSTAGITQADLFRLTTTINTPYNSVDVITTNWERPDEADDMFDKIGSGMSQSSGVFTFPATGIYLVSFLGRWYANGNTSGENHLFIDGTVDNSNYNDLTSSAQNVPNTHTSTVYTQTLVDITDTSNRKVRLKYYAGAGNQRLIGATNKNETFAIFIRLGDT